MNELKIFENQEFGNLRVSEREGQPYVCLADVCKILEIGNTSQLKTRLNQSGVITNEVGVQTGIKKDGTPSVQKINMTFINESNLYKVIFQSRKPEAEKFTEWVTSEVLPSIRKNGGYLAGQEDMNEDEIMAKAILYANRKIEDLKRSNNLLEVQNSQLTVANEIMKPKADYFDELVDRNLLTNFTETANELKVKRKDLINFLLEKKYVYRDKKGKLQPYKNKNNGLFEVKDSKNEKTLWAGTQTLITPKGRETFRILCQGL